MTVFSQRSMRRLEASLRRATPKGHETFISRTAPHQGLVPTSGPPCVQDTLRHSHRHHQPCPLHGRHAHSSRTARRMSQTVLPCAKISKDRLLSGAPRLRHLGGPLGPPLAGRRNVCFGAPSRSCPTCSAAGSSRPLSAAAFTRSAIGLRCGQGRRWWRQVRVSVVEGPAELGASGGGGTGASRRRDRRRRRCPFSYVYAAVSPGSRGEVGTADARQRQDSSPMAWLDCYQQ
jgi:hypothetical protein